MYDREQSDSARRWSGGSAGRRLQRLELAPIRAVDDVPPAFAQAVANGVGSDEVLVAPELDPLGQQPLSFFFVRYFFLALTAAVSAGTILSASPTTPRSAIFMIGASASLLMAMITLEAFMPTVCCIAPEIPTAM